MTAVPREAARAGCRPSHGISHETARLARPANVAKPTNGATIRFAGMENTGSSGSMSTWIGRVNTVPLWSWTEPRPRTVAGPVPSMR